jgi:raffinose/stachyose/melibiose transport system permease protein
VARNEKVSLRATLSLKQQRRPVRPTGAPRLEPRWTPYLLVFPGWLLYALVVLVPVGATFLISFTHWDGVSDFEWAALTNYIELGQPALREALIHALVLVVFFSFLPILIGLALAAVLASVRVRGIAIFQTVLFVPQVIASVVVAMAWRWIYAPDGPLNSVLGVIGLGGLARGWLGSFDFALPAIGFVGTWVATGLTLVLFLAGIARIPPDLSDAARVDGASSIREFVSITVPLLRPEIAVALVLTLIRSLRSFDLVYNLTQGGPGQSTTVPAYEVYRRAFLTGEVGLASALAVGLTAIIVVVSLLALRLVER